MLKIVVRRENVGVNLLVYLFEDYFEDRIFLTRFCVHILFSNVFALSSEQRSISQFPEVFNLERQIYEQVSDSDLLPYPPSS